MQDLFAKHFNTRLQTLYHVSLGSPLHERPLKQELLIFYVLTTATTGGSTRNGLETCPSFYFFSNNLFYKFILRILSINENNAIRE